MASGGHDIPEADIRRRYARALLNLIALLPLLTRLHVYDNSTDVPPGAAVPDPALVLDMERGQVRYPAKDDLEALQITPEWAKPIVQAAFGMPRR